nr:uncharacterized protein LOC123003175 [Drosophila takahashii]
MSTTNILFKRSLAGQQMRHKKLYNNLTHILGRCEDLPQRTQSDDSLTRIHFNPTDASSADPVTNWADFSRLPAGAACSCRSISGRSVPAGCQHRPLTIISESTQTASTQEMSTQTGIQVDANEEILDCKFSEDKSTQSALNMQDAETQSMLDSPKNINNSQTQTEMIVLEKSEKAVLKSETLENDKSDYDDVKPPKSNSSLRKCFFRRPVIVVNGGTFIPSDFANKVHQDRAKHPHSPFLVTLQKEDKETQYEGPFASEENHLNHRTNGPSTCIKILDRVEELETMLRRQERSLKDLQGSVRSWNEKECKPSDCRIIFQAQPKNCQLPGKPATFDQATQKKDEDDCQCRSLSKEFIQIFIKPESANQTKKSNNNGCGASSPNNANSGKSITMPSVSKSCKDDKEENSRKNNKKPIDTQCLEDADNFLEQFNRVFAKSKSEETICGETKKIQRPISPCCSKENVKENTLNTRKVSSTSCLDTKKTLKHSVSNQTEEKEVYKSLIEQFVNLFAKSKTCENKQAQKAEPESYSFDGIMAELLKLFTKPKGVEPGALKDEERPKKVTISEKETVLGAEQKPNCSCSKAQRSVKSISTQSDLKMSDMDMDARNRVRRPCELDRNSTISGLFASNVSIKESQRRDPLPCRCQFCGDGSQPVLDSLLSELFQLIGPRSFTDVVLTILRHQENVYHINVREMATGNVLGCILGNGTAINEAIALGLFEDIHTFCELDRRREHDPRDCPLGLDALCPRERGGEMLPDESVDKERAIEFSIRVLGVPAGQAGRFFSLTNALKLARKSNYHSFGRGRPGRRGRIGRGAVTGQLVYLGSDDHLPVKDWSEPSRTSSLFLRIVSGQDNDAQEDESKVVEYHSTRHSL